MKIAGLDIGTSACKCTVFDGDGAYVDRTSGSYPLRTDLGETQIDAALIRETAFDVLRRAAALHPDIGAIGVTSFGEAAVPVGADGEPLAPCILYTDPRGLEECAELSERLGERHIMEITGLKPHPMYTLPKLMWIRRHWPQLLERARHIFLIQDYIVWTLTGKRQIDHSLATRTMAFDIRSMRWSRTLFDAAGIDPDLFSTPVPTGTGAGGLTPAAASALGLSPAVQVVTVSHDQIASAVGAGAFDGSVAVDGSGSTECLEPVFDALPDMEAMLRGGYCVVPYVIPGKYVTYAFSYTGGALLRWCVETFGAGRAAQAAEQGITVNELLEKGSSSPTGLLVLPHFAGAGTPYMDPGARGAITGLTTATTAADIYRGCMEGVAYEMLVNRQALDRSGARFGSIRVTGGGARSAEWTQMKADILGMPATAMRTVDAGTVGSAMLTAVAVGHWADLKEAAAAMVKEAAAYEPRPDMHARYIEVFERYRSLYRALRPLT